MRPDLDELMVTSGGMECIALTCRGVLAPGDTSSSRRPTYLGALMAFESARLKVEGVPMDEHGLQVDALEERLDGRAAAEVALRDPRVPEPVRPHARRSSAATRSSSCAAATTC